ncbi:MAG: pantoate--beta-alanine ligase [Vampirovibrionales bacterium]|nr:pantoate--beta-alanine ligase [Vampirovibrionales bacterium]
MTPLTLNPLLSTTVEAYWEKSKAFVPSLGQKQKIALVPTMGALHEGHLSLIRLAREHADRVVVSVFVNPLQFGPSEDFSRYPRTLEADLAACQAEGVDAVFAPDVAVIYPNGMENATLIVPSESLTDKLCGLNRPGHFTGVATVVYQLFQLLKPEIAVFGEKDAQQLAIVERMVKDLRLPVQIVPHPIVREADGLAMSSRNRYLKTPEDRQLALVLIKTLRAVDAQLKAALPASEQFLQGACFLQSAFQEVVSGLPQAEQKRFHLEYLEALTSDTLLPVLLPETSGEQLNEPIRLYMAARLTLQDGNTLRLIDNMLL